MMASANVGRVRQQRARCHSGIEAASTCGARPMAHGAGHGEHDEPDDHDRPEQARHPRRAALLEEEQHQQHADGHRNHVLARSPGSSSSRPSTALNTEIAGVIRASQKKNAVPASASRHQPTWTSRVPPRELRLASANRARMPPSPVVVRAHDDGHVFQRDRDRQAQKMSDNTPNTASLSNGRRR